MGATHWRQVVALIVCLGGAASACSTEATLPRSEYVSKVNGLCAGTTAEIDAALIPVIESYIRGLGTLPSDEGSLTDEQVMGLYAAVRPVAEDLNEVFSTMLSEIRSLPSPESDAAVFVEHWDRVEALWNEAYEAIVVASADPIAARALLAEPDPRTKPTNEAALGLGVVECVFD